jgi:hypothetical protein
MLLSFSVEGFSQSQEASERKQLFQIEEEDAKSQQTESLALQRLRASKKTKHITHVSLPDNLYQHSSFDIFVDPKSERIVAENQPNSKRLVIKRTDIKLEVYNLNGARVATLADGSQTAGQYSIAFNAQNLPSGTYIVRMLAQQKVFTQKITLIK